jgi:hypothetical protein
MEGKREKKNFTKYLHVVRIHCAYITDFVILYVRSLYVFLRS